MMGAGGLDSDDDMGSGVSIGGKRSMAQVGRSVDRVKVRLARG